MSEPGRTWGVIAIDLGNLRVFNEWYGREKGDELLSAVASYLTEVQRKGSAIAGYWGEDDFSVFGSVDTALVESIYHALSGIIAQRDASLGFRPAFGVYLLNPDERMGMDCYTCAAYAARQAKANLHHPINYFKEHRSQEPNNDFKILSCFHKAISEGDVYPEVQPQVDIHTGKLVGAEALARWHKEGGGIIPPGCFIPVPERTGFISKLDKYLWKQVITWLSDCLRKGIEPVPVSINVSRIDIDEFKVSEFLIKLLQSHRVPARYLKVEITETSFLQNMDKMTRFTQEMHDAGIKVMMDDFGSGLSSLSMLRNINIDIIKLDGNFIPELALNEEEKGSNIVFSMLTLANSVDKPLIIEGVETTEQVRLLDELGADYAQGYFFYRPMKLELLTKLLASGLVQRGSISEPSADFD
ncbi:MAG: GGDEF domain-containing phosphodiesterase [Coriobacteriia bacterium]|nr:GGDEF domain-containing phosphodiesterase [Coriobacteriia bacterium]